MVIIVLSTENYAAPREHRGKYSMFLSFLTKRPNDPVNTFSFILIEISKSTFICTLHEEW